LHVWHETSSARGIQAEFQHEKKVEIFLPAVAVIGHRTYKILAGFKLRRAK
jgi:hypothetical protein